MDFYPEISIDIVPCVRVKDWLPTTTDVPLSNFDRSAVDEAYEHGVSFIFNQPNNVYRKASYSDTVARVSFAYAESLLIRACPPVVKAAYMVGKWLTTADHKHDDEAEKCIFPSSHVLKTAVLTCVAEMEPMPDSATGRHRDPDAARSLDTKELTEWIQKLFRCLLKFSSQDAVPTLLMPNFCLPVWKYEEYLHFSRRYLQRCGVDYETIMNAPYCRDAELRERVRSSLARSYLLYWGVLDEGADIAVRFEEI